MSGLTVVNAKKPKESPIGFSAGVQSPSLPKNCVQFSLSAALPRSTGKIRRMTGTIIVETAKSVYDLEIPVTPEGGKWKSGVFKFEMGDVQENDPAKNPQFFTRLFWPNLKGKWTGFKLRRYYKSGADRGRNGALSMLNKFMIRTKKGKMIPLELIPSGPSMIGKSGKFGFYDNSFGAPLPLNEIDKMIVKIPQGFNTTETPFCIREIDLHLPSPTRPEKPGALPSKKTHDVDLSVSDVVFKVECRAPNGKLGASGKPVNYTVTPHWEARAIWSVVPDKSFRSCDVRLDFKPKLTLSTGKEITATASSQNELGFGGGTISIAGAAPNGALTLSGNLTFLAHLPPLRKETNVNSVRAWMRIEQDRRRLLNPRRRKRKNSVPFMVKNVPTPMTAPINSKLSQVMKDLEEAMAKKNKQQALTLVKKLESMAGIDGWAWTTLAHYYGKLNQDERRFHALEKAISIDSAIVSRPDYDALLQHCMKRKDWKRSLECLGTLTTSNAQMLQSFAFRKNKLRKRLAKQHPLKPVYTGCLNAKKLSKAICIDGKISEWDQSSLTFACPDSTFEKNSRNMRVALMYDTRNLYALIRRRKPSPMDNWDKKGTVGDYLDIKISQSQGDGCILRHYFSRLHGRAFLECFDLADFRFARHLNRKVLCSSGTDLGGGHRAAYTVHEDGRGYDMEVQIPLASLLNKKTLHGGSVFNILFKAGVPKLGDCWFINPESTPRESDYSDLDYHLDGKVELSK